MNKKGQWGTVGVVVVVVLLLIAGIFAVAFAIEQKTDQEPGFHPKLRNCKFIDATDAYEKIEIPWAFDELETIEVEIECEVVNLGDTEGDIKVELGIIPRVTAIDWGWVPPSVLSVGDWFGDPAVLRQTSCCTDNENVKAVSIVGLKPNEKVKAIVQVEVPHPRAATIKDLLEKSVDACGDDLMWDGFGNKYVMFAHLFERCWTPTTPSGSTQVKMQTLLIRDPEA